MSKLLETLEQRVIDQALSLVKSFGGPAHIRRSHERLLDKAADALKAARLGELVDERF